MRPNVLEFLIVNCFFSFILFYFGRARKRNKIKQKEIGSLLSWEITDSVYNARVLEPVEEPTKSRTSSKQST